MMKNHLPRNASWASFGISRKQMLMAITAVVMGGRALGPAEERAKLKLRLAAGQ